MRWRRRASVALCLSLVLSVSPATAHADLNAAINAYRAAYGVPALAGSELLETVAHQRVIEIAQPGGWGHVDLGPRLGCWQWGEIIASNNAGDPVSWAVWTQWANSPTHQAVMLGSWTWIGSGTYLSGGTTYLVAVFLGPCSGPPPGPTPIVEVIPDTAMDRR